jgi:hypothetical protein
MSQKKIYKSSYPKHFKDPPDFVQKFPSDISKYPLFPEVNKYIIALIPMKIPFTSLKPVVFTEEIQPHSIRPNKVAAKVAKTMEDCVDIAISAGAKIICFSEYCFPESEKSHLLKIFSEQSNNKKVCIIAGSYATTNKGLENAYNTSLVFVPGQNDPYIQYKYKPGKFKGEPEKIKIPDKHTANIIHTKYGKFMVLVCATATDGDTQDNVAVINRNDNKFESVDLIFVPAYTSEPEKFVPWDCKTISDTSGTCVFYVSDYTFGNHEKVFFNGKDQTNKLESIGNDSEWCGKIKLFKMNLAALRNERISSSPTDTSDVS